ncbi:L-2-hydroxyglutarate oxidase [Devosia sp. A449]
MRYDFCVIGGGIVGLATARALLAARPGASLIVLEKEDQLGIHQTGRNSGVVHSGIYYAPGSLKARLCSAGMRMTKDYCRAHAIAFEERGKLIVATSPLEVERLDALEQRAATHGIPAQSLSRNEITAIEPAITGIKALHVPSSAIVNYRDILAVLAADVRRDGGEIAMRTAPLAIRECGADVELDLGERTIIAAALVACAGLQSDRVARMAGLDVDFAIVPFRGEYFRLAPRRAGLVNAMIYPVPDPALPFLGIHLTPMIDGSISLGPNAVLGLAREGYGKRALSLEDLADAARFPGLWHLLGKNLKSALDELSNSVFTGRYLAACRKYCPELELSDLTPMPAGIRAQAVKRDGSMVQDFLMLETARMLHVCNAPSPAATSSLPIADYIADRLLARLKA